MSEYRFFTTQKNCPAIWGPNLRREPLYACSCLSFCVLGAWLIAFNEQVHEWLAAGGGPLISQRLLLVHGWADVFQGLLSLSSDVVLVDVPSAVHLGDRLLAVVLTAVGVYVEVCVLLFSPLPAVNRLLMLALLISALVHHFRAKAGIRDRVYCTYVTSHTLWHLLVTASLPVPVHFALFY